MDVHFRAQVLPSRKAYDEKHSDLGGGREGDRRGVHEQGERFFYIP